MPSTAPRQGTSAYSAGAALGVALAAAGLGVVAGRQAMLFTSNANKGKPIKKAPNAGLPSGLGTSEGAGAGGSRGNPYQSRKNMQKQRNGFGAFVQKFQTVSGKSKYGVPIFLP